jgi:serine/threonine-protein kinase
MDNARFNRPAGSPLSPAKDNHASGKTQVQAHSETAEVGAPNRVADRDDPTTDPNETIDKSARSPSTDDSGGWIGTSVAGRYLIRKLLGQGGMSRVFLAEHELLSKRVAIKVLNDELAGNRAALQRFHREAVSAAGVGDPHIVDITDYGFTENGDAFIVMEYLEGRDLRQIIAQERVLNPERAVLIAHQILQGLQAAHDRGIVHRDLKAENIFVTARHEQEFVKILDFGISKLLPQSAVDAQQALTSTGMVMGTPQCISPEQAEGEQDIDHRADLYAVGVILYEMLTGELPFSGKNALELMLKHVNEKPRPMRKRRPDLQIPPLLDEVVLRALSKKRSDRYASANEMRAALPPLPTPLAGQPAIGAGRAPSRGYVWPLFVIALAAVSVAGFYLLKKPASDAPNESESGSDSSRRNAASTMATDLGPEPDTTRPGAVADRTDQGRSDLAQAGAHRPEAADASATPAPKEPDAAARRTHQLAIRTVPLSARIYIDNRLQGTGTTRIRVAANSQHWVTVSAEGYKTQRLRVGVTTARLTTQLVTLDPLTKKKNPRKEKSRDILDNPYTDPVKR